MAQKPIKLQTYIKQLSFGLNEIQVIELPTYSYNDPTFCLSRFDKPVGAQYNLIFSFVTVFRTPFYLSFMFHYIDISQMLIKSKVRLTFRFVRIFMKPILQFYVKKYKSNITSTSSWILNTFSYFMEQYCVVLCWRQDVFYILRLYKLINKKI